MNRNYSKIELKNFSRHHGGALMAYDCTIECTKKDAEIWTTKCHAVMFREIWERLEGIIDKEFDN